MHEVMEQVISFFKADDGDDFCTRVEVVSDHGVRILLNKFLLSNLEDIPFEDINFSELELGIVFHDDFTTCSIYAQIVDFPESKKDAFYKLSSKLNSKERFTRFFVNEAENIFCVGSDFLIAAFDNESFADSGYKILNFCGLVLISVNDAYPEIMAAKWE